MITSIDIPTHAPDTITTISIKTLINEDAENEVINDKET